MEKAQSLPNLPQITLSRQQSKPIIYIMEKAQSLPNLPQITLSSQQSKPIKMSNGGASATICSQPTSIQDGSREYGREQEEQASKGRAGYHGPRTYSASRLTAFMDRIRNIRVWIASILTTLWNWIRNIRDDNGGVSATICSQPTAIQDGSRKYGREQEEQASAGRTGAHGPRTYSGLQNQGSTCYLNTVLQILFMTDECREAVMRPNEADGNPVSEQLKKLFDKLNRNQVPDTKGITHSLGITDVCRQEDASEYFKKILSKVNPDVTKIYEGTIKETVTCEKQHQLKECSSSFTLIPLSINNPSSGIISVEDAWKDHFKRTDTLNCNSCESETLAQFESKINVSPQILALHLDRLFSGQKNTCKVKIPSTLTDKGWTYELYAIANHHGSPRGGHYNAFIKPYGDECWWLFDDSHVRKMEELQTENLLNSSAADLLFYKKISSDDLKAENTLEKGNDSYPSQDHQKRPSESNPAAWIAAEDLSSSRETIREGMSPEPVGAGAATAMGGSQSEQQTEETPQTEQHEQAVKQKTPLFQITVNGFSDKLIVIKFECSQEKFDSTTTLELKEKIIAEHLKGSGMDTDSVRLVFASTPMEDEKTFSDYGIRSMSMVMMITRMPGGHKPQSVP